MGHVTTAFEHAATGASDLATLQPLPDRVVALLREVKAPARLVAHLRAVHDVAHRLLDVHDVNWPEIPVDGAAVCFGAATHAIGKALHPKELSSPGGKHVLAGLDLLLRNGVDERLARFAVTHEHWRELDDITIEDLLVALADQVWRGERDEDLVRALVDLIAHTDDREPFEVFVYLDKGLEPIVEGGPDRVAFQNSLPIR